MRRVKFLALIMIAVIAISSLPVSAAWDRLENNDDSTSGTSAATSAKYLYSSIKTKIGDAKKANTDVVGWLTVPGTNMDFPILYSDTGNDYYEYRDVNGKKYSGLSSWNYVDTATYMDFRAKLGTGWRNGTSKNIVLYGHNWNNLRDPFVIGNQSGYSMFAQLPSYTSVDFAKSNPHVYFSTPEMEGIWRVFAVGYCELSTDFFYNNPNPSTEKYKTLLDEWKARSLHNFGVDVDTSDRIITLSTCTRQYGSSANQRFVVVARLLRDGETENDSVTVAANASVKQPSIS